MMPNEPLYSVKTTALIFLLLIIPFLIRSSAPDLEPYPAIVLPLGVGLFDLNQHEIDVKITSIWGKTKDDDKWDKINTIDFMDPIPRQYFYKIIDSKFGFKQGNTKKINTAFWNEIDIPKKEKSEKAVEETKTWLKMKLSSLGYSNHVLKVTKHIKTIDLGSEQETANKLIYEQTFHLD